MGNEVLAGWLAEIINRYLSLDPEAPGKITAFDGKIIALHLLKINKTLYLSIQGTRVHVTEHFQGLVDTTITGTPLTLFKMGVTSNITNMMLNGEVDISGDIRLGKSFKKFIAEIEIDREDYLSRVVGDVTAHHVVLLSDKLIRLCKQSGNSLLNDLSEYLQEESRDVISAAELEMFYDDVDILRDDVDRIQARISQLGK